MAFNGVLDLRVWDLKGPNSRHVKFISSDNEQFILEREHVMISSTVKIMFEHPEYFDKTFFDIQTSSILFRGIPSKIMSTVCGYFIYNARYGQYPIHKIPKFYVCPNLALEIMMTAIFFDI